jgi:hypothetical protein
MPKRRREEPADLEPVSLRQSFALRNVATVMAEVMQPGTARDKAEFADLFKAYAQVRRQQGKRPLPPEEFSDALQRFCNKLGIKSPTKASTSIS